MALEVITSLFVIRWFVKRIKKRKKDLQEEERVYTEQLGVYQDTIEQQFPRANIAKVWGIKTKGVKKDV